MIETIEQLLDAANTEHREVVPVDVPGWKDKAYIRRLSYREVKTFTVDGSAGLQVDQVEQMAVLSICNKDGMPLLKPNQHDLVGSWSFDALDTITDAVVALNGLSKAAQQDVEKN